MTDVAAETPDGLTGISHVHSASVEEAARWLSRHRQECPKNIIPFVRERFGLSNLEAIEALKSGHALAYPKGA